MKVRGTGKEEQCGTKWGALEPPTPQESCSRHLKKKHQKGEMRSGTAGRERRVFLEGRATSPSRHCPCPSRTPNSCGKYDGLIQSLHCSRERMYAVLGLALSKLPKWI